MREDRQQPVKIGDLQIQPGKPLPFGSTIVPGGVNFSVFSSYATYCELALFRKKENYPFAVVPFPDDFRIGNVFSMIVLNLDIENLEYGFRMDGPFNPKEGHLFDKSKMLMDPYAQVIGGRETWRQDVDWANSYQHRACINNDAFDWGHDKPLEVPIEDLIIYEMHVRSFTAHPSAGTESPGTFQAIRNKIPYLKELGVNCIELMPIHEFDEFENPRFSPVTKERLLEYWGYNNVGFFAPKASYAAAGQSGKQVQELKSVIKELHRNGIEVILDVVFNHTAEGNKLGKTISYRGIDNRTYYMLKPNGDYYNFSGCGNTMNCNNPIVRNMILDCLRYWVVEYHIDGFRFDLASILGRDQNGVPMSNPPLIETLAFDPILGRSKLIAEAWDAGGLYQVGSFPAWGRWAEWNGKFRDDVRRFVKGDDGTVAAIVERVQGSPDLYKMQNRGACASINFITAHDGFTLNDLVSFNAKHNEANGEDNQDGLNENCSWNCGEEGETKNQKVLKLRRRQIKNLATILLTSQGVPMMLSGDEFRNTQFGNNNAYCHDNEISWLNWADLEKNDDTFRFFQKMIAFRKIHPAMRNEEHLMNANHSDDIYPDISFHGVKPGEPDLSFSSHTIAYMLSGQHDKPNIPPDDYIYIAMNMHWESHLFELPELPDNRKWVLFADTALESPDDICEPGSETALKNQKSRLVADRSIIILIGK